MPLNADVMRQILGRADSLTLANAACVSSHFWCIVREEIMWEEKCCSLWLSIADRDIKQLISSSLGGFRKFYVNCFPFIVYDEYSERDSNWNELHDQDRLVPSDLVWVVDLQYKNRVIFSKVIWGIPYADNFPRWFAESPFRIDIISLQDVQPTPFMSFDEVGIDNKFTAQLMDNIKLSWILINRRSGQAANLSCWSPLDGQRHFDSDMNILMRFGSILSAHNILPCKFVQCIIEMKCRVSDSLPIIELNMRLEDMMGDDVNGRNSLLILEKSMGCGRRKDRSKFLESHTKYLTAQSKFREANVRSEACTFSLFIISVIIACISFCYLISR